MESNKGLVGIIFVVVAMVILFIAFYSVLVNFVEATPEQGALKDAKQIIEEICSSEGADEQVGAIFLPADWRIVLNEAGTIELQGSRNIVKTLSCPTNVEFSKCTMGYTTSGSESITFTIKKIAMPDKKYLIKLDDTFKTDLVNCE